MKRSPSLKGSRVSSAQNNNSIAISEDKPPTPKTKFIRMKNYAEEQKNISKRQEQMDPLKIIESNEKLKEELNLLVEHLDSIVVKKKEKLKQKKLEKNKKPDEPQEQRQILSKQEKQIVENTMIIKQLQQQLENTYQNATIQQKEDNNKYLLAALEKLNKEIESQQKIQQKQTEGLNQIDYKDQQNKIDKLKRDIQHEQRECREVHDDISKNEKIIQKLHNIKVTKSKTIKQIEQKIKEKKNKPDEEITNEMITQIEIELKDLMKTKEQQQLQYSENLKKLEQQRNEAKQELEKTRIKLMKLEREYKINKVFIHEGNRYIKMDDRNSQRSTKPNLSGKKKPTTPSRNTPSPRSNLNKQPSTKEIEIIKEEQFEETIALNQEQKEKPTTPITEIIKEEEDQISIVEQDQQQIPAQQNKYTFKSFQYIQKTYDDDKEIIMNNSYTYIVKIIYYYND